MLCCFATKTEDTSKQSRPDNTNASEKRCVVVCWLLHNGSLNKGRAQKTWGSKSKFKASKKWQFTNQWLTSQWVATWPRCLAVSFTHSSKVLKLLKEKNKIKCVLSYNLLIHCAPFGYKSVFLNDLYTLSYVFTNHDLNHCITTVVPSSSVPQLYDYVELGTYIPGHYLQNSSTVITQGFTPPVLKCSVGQRKWAILKTYNTQVDSSRTQLQMEGEHITSLSNPLAIEHNKRAKRDDQKHWGGSLENYMACVKTEENNQACLPNSEVNI